MFHHSGLRGCILPVPLGPTEMFRKIIKLDTLSFASLILFAAYVVAVILI